MKEMLKAEATCVLDGGNFSMQLFFMGIRLGNREEKSYAE